MIEKSSFLTPLSIPVLPRMCYNRPMKMCPLFSATVFLSSFTLLLTAADTEWTAAGGGAFNDGGNWSSGVPGASDQGIFDLDATFGVTFDANYSSNQLLIGGAGLSAGEHVDVTFNLFSDSTARTYSILGTGVEGDAIRVFGANNPDAPSVPGASLTITGGTLSALRAAPEDPLQVVRIADGVTNASALVAVTGAGARLEADRLRLAQGNGNIGRLLIENGATADFGAINVNESANSNAQGYIQVTGNSSVLTAGSLGQGQSGLNSITVENQGQMILSGTMLLVQRLGEASVLVDGASSLLQAGTFQINSAGTGTRVVDVIVNGGGELRTGVVEFNRFGSPLNVNNMSTALITGTDSKWVVSNANGFNLSGRLPTEGNADKSRMIVADGGVLETTRLTIHYAGELTGNSSVTVSQTIAAAIWNRGGLVAPGLVAYSHTHDGTEYTVEAAIGTLTLNGNYTQQVMNIGTTEEPDYKIGTLRIRVGDAAADRLNILGNVALVSLNGINPLLDIVAFGSPSLSPNDTFTILDWNDNAFTGTFDITAFDPGQGLSWDFSNLYIDGTISVIPEPGTVALMIGLAGLCVVFLRRR